MAGEYPLKNETQTDWKLHDNTWKAGVDKNWKILDWRATKWVAAVHPSSATLPAIPNDGDAFIVENVNQVWIWNVNTNQFDKINLSVTFIFYDENLNDWYQWKASVITPFPAGGGGIIPPNYEISDSSGAFGTTNTTPTDVTNLDVTITTIGNPVNVYLVGDGSGTTSAIGIRNVTPASIEARGFIDILRDGVVVAHFPLYLIGGGTVGNNLWMQIPPGAVHLKEELPAGTYNYTVQIYGDAAIDPDQNIQCQFVKLVAEEQK